MEFNSDKASACSAEDSSFNEVSVIHETAEDSVVYLNSKDELNWVATEIVVVESCNDKAIATSIDGSLNNGCNIDIPQGTADKAASSPSVQKSAAISNDDSETKLWEYFTEHNSSQLKCKLCLGLFLYQGNASHLLRHVEVVHNLSVLPSNKDVESNTDLKKTNDNSSLISNISSNVVGHLNETLEHDDNGDALVAQTKLSKAMIEQISRVQKYFTKLVRDKIRCNLCCRVMSNKLNRFTMLRHLKSNHLDTYQCAMETSDDKFVKLRRSDCSTSYKSKSNEKRGSLNKTQRKNVDENELLNKIWEYFTKVGFRDRARCNICKCLLKFTKGIYTNLVRHLKSNHRNIYFKGNGVLNKSSNKKKVISDKEKECTTSFVLEIIQDGDKCLITNARLCTGNSQAALSELTNITGNINKNRRLGLSAKSGVNNEDVGRIKDPQRKSKIWNYFIRLNFNKRGKCKICSEILSYKHSTLKLFNHMSLKHGVDFTKTSVSLDSEFVSEVQSDNENLFFEYERKNELTVDDISNINLSSIFHSERSNKNQVKRKIKHKRSISGLWKYFTKLYRDKAMCILCDKTFSYKLGQMSNLIKHLQIQHMFNCNQLKSDRKAGSLNVDSIEVRKDKIDVWKFFTRLDDSKVECDLCEHANIFYHSSGSVSNLRKHLHSKHKYFLDLSYYTKRTILYDGNKIVESNCSNSEETSGEHSNRPSAPGIDMKVLFEYFSTDPNLRDWIKFENEQISCKLCAGMFLFNDLLNFEYTIKCHLQTCRTDSLSQSRSQFLDNSLDHEDNLEIFDVLDEASNSSYNELEAISEEIKSFKK